MSEKPKEETTNKTVQMQIDELTETVAQQKAELDAYKTADVQKTRDLNDANHFLQAQINTNLNMKLKGVIPIAELDKMSIDEKKAAVQMASKIRGYKSINFSADGEEVNPQDLFTPFMRKLKGGT